MPAQVTRGKADLVQILDVMQKALEGKPMSENDYQLRSFASKVQEKVKEHGIKYDPQNPVPSDDSMADEVFEAGFEVMADVGAYCMTTGRVISFTESEIKEGLRNAPSSMHFGEGKDRKKFVPRKIEDKTPPWCLLGAGGGPVSNEATFLKLMEGYAEIPETNAITTPALTRAGGMRLRPGSPLEVLAAMRNATLAREACNRAGRPGIPFMNSLATAECDVSFAAALHPRFGMRPSDGYMIASMDPMKIDFQRLNKSVVVHSLGGSVGCDFSPLMGGYSGGPEGTAVCTVATHLMALLTLGCTYFIPFPLHLRYVSNSSREMLWIISTMAQAVSRNTHLLSLSLNYTAAGPCTEMALQESSASAIAAVASGLSIESGGYATNKYEDRETPVEPRITAEAAHAFAGRKRKEANDICNSLLRSYESKLKAPPLGKTVHECWDADARRPTKEYASVLRKFKSKMSDLGLELREEL
jgi:methylamine--corrinoid protein Co-methyltransferase